MFKLMIPLTLLQKLFNDSLTVFFERETENILSDVNERNLCSRLAIILESKFPEFGLENYRADADYNRMQDGKVKTMLDGVTLEPVTINCDLIVHSRGTLPATDNLIAVEMKKPYRTAAEKDKDRKRLRTLTKSAEDGVFPYDGTANPRYVCGYRLGFYMEIDAAKKRCLLEEYQAGRITSSLVVEF